MGEAESLGVVVGGLNCFGVLFDSIHVPGEIAQHQGEQSDTAIRVHQNPAAAVSERSAGVFEGQLDHLAVDLKKRAERHAQFFSEDCLGDVRVQFRLGGLALSERPHLAFRVGANRQMFVHSRWLGAER
jgi:hypothetical protein